MRFNQESLANQGLMGFNKNAFGAYSESEPGAASRCHPPIKGFTPDFSADDYTAYIRKHPLDIAPLGLYINYSSSAASSQEGKRAQFDNLLIELNLQAQKFNRRPIGWILWRNVINQLSSAEITELMYIVSSKFRLNHSPQREYCAEIEISQVDTESIALLKGLGFNQLQCRFNAHPDAARFFSQQVQGGQIQERLDLTKDYGFEGLATQVVYGHAQQDLHQLRKLLDQLLSLSPTRIQLEYLGDLIAEKQAPAQPLASVSNSRNQFMLLYNALRNDGYRVIGNDCFMRPSDKLANAQNHHRLRRTCFGYNASNVSDFLGFGPASFSQVGSVYTQNNPSIDGYQRALGQRQLPIQSGLKLDASGKRLRLVLDQLLCYHRLDIGYLESRYNFDFQAQFGIILAAMQENASSPLMTMHNKQLNLTPEGIVNLRAICRSLLFQEDPSLLEPPSLIK